MVKNPGYGPHRCHIRILSWSSFIWWVLHPFEIFLVKIKRNIVCHFLVRRSNFSSCSTKPRSRSWNSITLQVNHICSSNDLISWRLQNCTISKVSSWNIRQWCSLHDDQLLHTLPTLQKYWFIEDAVRTSHASWSLQHGIIDGWSIPRCGIKQRFLLWWRA